MCGIAGFIGAGGGQDLTRTVQAMTDTLVHRGPDDAGAWVDEVRGVALGHRRLSILDLSPAGHQPMLSACGRYVLVFNGEIYNHLELRRELSGHWRGHSDTETLLAGICAWGLEETLKKTVGMFALALWDRKTACLSLARDRMGEKPLYFGWNNKNFLFGSELKALQAHPDFSAEVDRDALALYLRRNCVPAPYSIYKGIFKLPPATIICLPYAKIAPGTTALSWHDLKPACSRYWSLDDVARQGQGRSLDLSPAEATERLDAQLRQAVGRCLMSDVPLGAFLSGGIDSSLVVALMQTQVRQPVQTFTIGFDNVQYNEAEQAKAVARHLGTDHTELYVTAQQAREVIPQLPGLYDEPFADSSQIPTFLVAQLARRKITVALSGDGGDELFGGYNRHSWAPAVWWRMAAMPPWGRKLAARSLSMLTSQQWDSSFRHCAPLLPGKLRQRTPGDKLQKLANALGASSQLDLYNRLTSHWQSPDAVVLQATDSPSLASAPAELGFAESMMFYDQCGYLPDDILVKVDRATMAVSLEARAPLLDYQLVELAWQLPLAQKIHQGQGKWLLRQVLYRYVPQALIERPKMGFAVPIDEWLRGPLRDWAESLLDEWRLRQEGYFNPAPIRQKWQEHLAGQFNWQYQIWDILMFQAWLAENR